MRFETVWAAWARYAVAALLGAVVAWYAFIANREVPILDWFDLGIHEIGHMMMAFAPTMLMFLAGSVSQVAVPLALAWYFGIVQGDRAGGGFCMAWAGASAWDVSVYIADAPVQALPLIGAGQHDWAYLLGPQGFNAMSLSSEVAGFVELVGAVLAVLGISVAISAMVAGLKPQPVPVVASLAGDPSVASAADPWAEAAKLPFRYERAS